MEKQLKYKSYFFNVAGTSYKQREIESIGVDNPEYDYTKKEIIDEGLDGERIYQIKFYPELEIIPDPNNEFDKNALKVVVNDKQNLTIKDPLLRGSL